MVWPATLLAGANGQGDGAVASVTVLVREVGEVPQIMSTWEGPVGVSTDPEKVPSPSLTRAPLKHMSTSARTTPETRRSTKSLTKALKPLWGSGRVAA